MAEEKISEKIKGSWEFKTVFFILRVLGVLAFVVYLGMSAPAAFAWGQVFWVRSQPLAQLETIRDRALAADDPMLLTNWVQRRPMFESDEIMQRLEPDSGKIGSLLFLRYARYLHQAGQNEEAAFWQLYARYRLRYDALRCGAPDGPETMTMILGFLAQNDVQESIEADDQKLATEIERVLKFDAKYPAENNPSDICPIVQKLSGGNYAMVPRENWAVIRHTLRMVTELSIKEMQGEKN